jgi:hypothetical protein
MNAPTTHGQPESGDVTHDDSRAADSDSDSLTSSSRFQKFAATQAAGDGVQGDARKPDKSVDEKIGANMADRK